MEFKAKRTQATPFEAIMDDIQGSALLGNEQYFLSVLGDGRDNVRNRLGLARAWWTLHHEVPALLRRRDDLGLKGIGIQDVPEIPGVGETRVEVLVGGKDARVWLESADQDVLKDPGPCGAIQIALRVQVPPH